VNRGFLYYRNIGLSIFALVFGCYFLIAPLINPLNGLPNKSELVGVSGKVYWIKSHDYGVKFKLENDETIFNYPSKANSVGIVESALEYSENNSIKVLIKLNDFNKNLITGQEYTDIYEISVGDNLIRSYDDVKDAWAGDNKVGLFLGPFMIFAAFYIYRKAKKGEYGSSQIYY
jgi:hypothetical protein